jgi:hypothetical protein
MIKEQLEQITHSRKTVEDSLFFNTSGLSENIVEKLSSYYNQKLDNPDDNINFNNMQRIVFYKTIEHTLFALFLFDLESETFLVNEGYFHKETKQLINNNKHFLFEKKNDQIFQVYLENDMYDLKLRLLVSDNRYYVYGAIAQNVSLITDPFDNIEKLLYRFYFRNSDFLKDLVYYDILPELNKSICEVKDECLEKNQKMHLVLIQIEPLKKYIKVAGDYLVNDIIKKVKAEINMLIGDLGICYILNSRQYLIIARGIDETFIKEKFGHAHFRIKNLLLVYQLKYFQIENLHEECNIAVVWEKFLVK